MAYGIGSVIGDIDQKVDTYRNKPEALAQMYQQNQQLIDLLALQKLKTEKEAAMRDMQMKMQTPAASIKDQREQEVMGMMRNEVAQQIAPGLQAAGQQAAQEAAPPAPEGGGLQSLPAPNMQGMGMAEGGIVAFGGERGSYVSQEAYRRQKAKERAEKERRELEASAAELEAAQGTAELPYSSESILQDIMSRANRPTSTGREDVAPVDPGPGSVEPRVSREALRKFDEQRAAGDQDSSSIGLGSLLNRAGSRIQARPYIGQDYVRLMENPDLASSEEDKQLEAAKRMGLIPDERAPTAPQAAPQPAPQPAPQAATQPAGIPTVGPQIDEDAAYRKSLERGLPQQAGIRAALPQNQTPPASVELSEEGMKAVLNIPSEAVKQAPPEVQNEYTRRLSELRGEQESKLDALIAFLQGAGGKTSFAATMAGGAAGMNAREQQIEDEIMATVDKIEGLKLKEREFGISEEKNAIDREQLGISRASQAAQQEYYEALAEAARRVTPEPTTDQDERANTYVKAARDGGDTRTDAVIRQEHFEIEANRAAEAAADRLGITSEQQRQKLFLDTYDTAAKSVNGNLANASKTPEEREELIQATIEQIYKSMQSIGAPAPTQQNSGATSADPNDPLAHFYH